MSVNEAYDQLFCGGGILHPIRVEWQAGEETRSEMTRLLDFDSDGAAFTLASPPEVGQLLRLTQPAAGGYVYGDSAEGSRETWALVWALVPACVGPSPRHIARVLFCGSDVPRPVAESNSETYKYVLEDDGRLRLQRDAARAGNSPDANRRRESRIYLPYEVSAQVLGDENEVQDSVLAVTENVSRRGAALRTTLVLPPNSHVRLVCEAANLTLDSIVRASRVGPDNVSRLHVEFLNGQWPL
jgi:hypothetical protein